MAEVTPFAGILYNPVKVSGNEAAAPPYDIITPAHKDVLYEKSPYNIVRIDFGREMPEDSDNCNKYTRAKDYLSEWLKEDVLVRDAKPSFYAYEVEYQLSGEKKKLRGIIATVEIEELGEGVYPHEATHSKPRADRLNLMKSCMGNISPIYSLYNSHEKIALKILDEINEKPYFEATDFDGAIHRLYKISDNSQIEIIKAELSDKPIFIADGHHRYEVALEFKKEMNSKNGPGPWDYVLMFLANMSDEGITILPTHRLIKGLSKDEILKKLENDFSISQIKINLDTADSDINKALSESGKNAFGLYIDNEDHWYLLKYKSSDLKDVHPALRSLDVVVLHELILKKDLAITDVAYEMDIKTAINRIRKDEFNAAFFLNPTDVNDVEMVALNNMRMPPKSTYFYPKLLTGMVINKWEG